MDATITHERLFTSPVNILAVTSGKMSFSQPEFKFLGPLTLLFRAFPRLLTSTARRHHHLRHL